MVSFGVGALPNHGTWSAVLASGAGLLAGLALLWRDRMPRSVVAATTAAYLVQVFFGGPVLPAAVAVATETLMRRTAPDGRPQFGASVTVMTALIGVDAAVVVVGSPFLAAPFGVLLLGAALLGTLRAARAARDRQARRELVVAERLRIARDLHDVVGHGVGAITVQAGAARMALAAGVPAEATRALLTIESAGRSVLREVRWLVGLLREDAERPALAGISDLIGNARRSGLDVELTVLGELDDTPAETGEAAYRIVQEALTNVIRHSGTYAAAVDIQVTDALHVGVVDAGNEFDPSTGFVEGNGVRGIRERVAAVSGTVRIGPQSGGGWAVRAVLPLDNPPR
jgi:signal transduction histidine kinase